jgi:hypothetical protein
MGERLLIKHAVGGRTFLDSAQQELAYELRRREGGWRFDIAVPAGREADVAELLRLKDELNVFVFRVLPDGRQEKTWYYTGDGNVSYDAGSRQLTVWSGPELRYLPAEYWP